MERIDRELETAATPEAVWDAVADPAALSEWLDAEVELELWPGGAGRFRSADGEVRRAMVQEVIPGHELTFSWWRAGGAETTNAVGPSTTVTITVEPTPTGGARLRLREVGAQRARAAA